MAGLILVSAAVAFIGYMLAQVAFVALCGVVMIRMERGHKRPLSWFPTFVVKWIADGEDDLRDCDMLDLLTEVQAELVRLKRGPADEAKGQA